MKILIGGAGKVGYNLAKFLSPSHEVTIIDKNSQALEYISETLDVLTIHADLRNILTYKLLKEKYDFFLAVTNNDEVNLLSSVFIDDYISANHKISRLKNTSYLLANLNKKFNIDHFVYPLKITSSTIHKITKNPLTNTIKEIPFTNFVLTSTFSQRDMKVSNINSEDCIVIGVFRNDEFIFTDDYVLKEDLVYILCKQTKLNTALEKLSPNQPKEIKNVLIFGAEDIGIEIAKELSEMNINIKIIEKNEEKAKKAAEILQEDVMVINASYEDENLFISENLHLSDMAIAATKFDETNIIKGLFAKKIGIKKIVCINNNPNYYSMMTSLKLPSIRGPKLSAVSAILEEINNKGNIYEKFFLGMRGKIFIKKVFNPTTFSPPKEKAKVVIIRDEKIIIPSQKEKILPNDVIIEFNFSGNATWIENL
ncbi:MAG: portal protein [Epsilonproteobacteria bacterium]|nr:portal protein [Campylobacterota bacterium]